LSESNVSVKTVADMFCVHIGSTVTNSCMVCLHVFCVAIWLFGRIVLELYLILVSLGMLWKF